MSQQALLKRVVQVLNAAGVAYMATGSIVSSLQGEPRSSHDIDFVVALSLASIREMKKAFPPPHYYLDEQTAQAAIARADMFNLLEVETGDKVDFWSLMDTPFDRSRLSRRRAQTVFGFELFVSTPEDTI